MPIKKYLFWMILLTGTLPTLAYGQHTQRLVLDIVAIVGDKVITEYDLEQRNRLIISNAKLPNTPQIRSTIRGPVLNQLIDESIKIQEAERLDILPSREEAQQTFENIAKTNNMTTEQLTARLQQQGVSAGALIDQFHAKLAWNNVIRQNVTPKVQISDSEVDQTLSKITNTPNKTQVDLSEIFIAKSDPQRTAEIRQLAGNLVGQIMSGARFPSIAQQFSQKPSAETSGRIGWKFMTELQPSLAEAVKDLPMGHLSSAVETPRGFYIVYLHNRRDLGTDAMQDHVQLSQMIFPAAPDDAAAMTAARQQAQQYLQQDINSCETFTAAATALGTPGSGDVGFVTVNSLTDTYRQTISTLPLGQPSQPLETPAGIAVVMICDKKQEGIPLPSHQQIQQALRLDRINDAARRYLRDLRLDATIEFK